MVHRASSRELNRVPIVLVQAKPLENFGSAIDSGACSRRGSRAVEAAGFRDLFSGFDFTIYERALNTPPNTPLRITAPSGFEHSSDIYDNHPALDYEIIPTP